MGSSSPSSASTPLAPLPGELTRAIEQAGYYPALVGDVVQAALAGESVVSHLVHQETTFDHDVVRRHITVLALTETRLVIAHADDHTDERPDHEDTATATTESIPLSAVRGVMLTHVVANPQKYQPGSLGREITLTLGWGAVNRVDLLPATCGDPDCDADHGYEGSISSDDISLRISAAAEGEAALQQALGFARELSASIGS
jgi:isopentenyl phosphate kinase